MSLISTIVRRSASFSVPLLLARFLSIALLPVYTRFLTAKDYGVLELLDLTLLVFSTLFGAQLSSAVFYFSCKGDKFDRDKVFSTALLGSLGIGILAAFVGLIGSRWVSQFVFGTADYVDAFRLYFLSLAFGFLAESVLAQLRADERVAAWVWTCILRLVSHAALIVVLLTAFGLGYYSFLWSNVICSALVGLLLAASFFRHRSLSFQPALFYQMVRYSLPLGMGSLGMLFIHYGDRFFLQRHVPLSDIGVYALAYKVGMLSYLVHTPFATYWNFEIFNVVRREDGDRTYVRTFTYLVLALCTAGALLAIFSRPLIRLLSAPPYHGAWVYVPWIAFAYVVRSIGDHLRGPLFVKAKTGTNAVANGAGFVLCLVGYVLFIPRWGVWGAVAATVLAFVVLCLYSFLAAQRIQHYRFEYSRLARIGLYSSAVCLPVVLWKPPGRLLDWLLSAGCALVLLLLLSFSGVLSLEERLEIRAMLGKLLRSAGRLINRPDRAARD